MPDLSRLFSANADHVLLLDQTLQGAGTVAGASWWPIHACYWVGFLLEITAKSAATAGQTLDVQIECSHDNFSTGLFPLCSFSRKDGAAVVVPDWELYQTDVLSHEPGLITDADLTTTLIPGPADNIGVGAGDFFPFGWVRARGIVTGTVSWSYRVWMYFQGA